MRIQSLILEFKGLRLVFTSDRVGNSPLWDRGQYGGTFHNSFGRRHFSGKKEQCQKKILHLYFLQLTSSLFQVSFLSQVNINSTNWPAPNVQVFRAQVETYCSADTDAIGLFVHAQ